jgi:hypothetical protein
VIRHECLPYLEVLAPPAVSEYPAPIEEEQQKEVVSQRLVPSGRPTAGADDAFEELVRRTPSYHLGWLRLGHAQLELAMRKRHADSAAALDPLNESVDALTRAAEHSDRPWQAQALYEPSKAYYHRGRSSAVGDGAGRPDSGIAGREGSVRG